MQNLRLVRFNPPKHDYKCAICHRKPIKDYEGHKSWICDNCRETRLKDIIEHNKKLKEKRKYTELVPKYNFKNIEEVMNEKFVFWRGKLYNIAIIRNWSYHFLKTNLTYFNKAILKENK